MRTSPDTVIQQKGPGRTVVTELSDSKEAIDALERTLTRVVGSKTPGLQYLVVDDVSTLIEFHAGAADISGQRAMEAATTLMAYSMSKTITAAAVLQLVEGHAVELDAPVARYLDWQPYGGAITIRQLLSHTSGIPNPIPLRWAHPVAAHAAFDEPSALRRVLERHSRLSHAPGTRFAYSNIGYWLLGAIVERAAGQPFTSYVRQCVLRPLGVADEELGYTIVSSADHAAGYLETYSLLNVVKRWLIDPDVIGPYAGRWVQIRDHYLNGPSFGGLVGTAAGFGKFLQDQLRDRSSLFGKATRALFDEQQRVANRPIPMTLGWHMGSAGGVSHRFKEGGGGGFHSMMRLYPTAGVGTVLMTNATGVNVKALLDTVDPLTIRAFSNRVHASAG